MTNSHRYISSVAVVSFQDHSGNTVLEGSMTFQSDGFTITWDNNETNGTLIHYMVVGGTDITGAQVGHFAKAGSTGIQSITTDADVQGIQDGEGVVFFLDASAPGFDSEYADHRQFIGAATGTGVVGYVQNAVRHHQCVCTTGLETTEIPCASSII